MKIIGLDFGGICGWAVGNSTGLLNSGTWDIRPRRGDSVGMRYVILKNRLDQLVQAHPDVNLVAYEQAHHRGGAATALAIGCESTMQAYLAEKGINHTKVNTAQLKKHATGFGNASKSDMRRVLILTNPYSILQGLDKADDNRIDAIWIFDWALKEHGS